MNQKNLQSLSKEDLSYLKLLYGEYLKEKQILNQTDIHLINCHNSKVYYSKKEEKLKENLNIVKNSSPKCLVEGILDANQKISSLTVDRINLNTSVLDDKYKKLFFKKSRNYLYNGLVTVALTLLLLEFAFLTKETLFLIFSALASIPTTVSFIYYGLETNFEPFTKKKLSPNNLNKLSSYLNNDLKIAHQESLDAQLKNQSFLNIKTNLLEKKRYQQQTMINNIIKEIVRFLNEKGISIAEDNLNDEIEILNKQFVKTYQNR